MVTGRNNILHCFDHSPGLWSGIWGVGLGSHRSDLEPLTESNRATDPIFLISCRRGWGLVEGFRATVEVFRATVEVCRAAVEGLRATFEVFRATVEEHCSIDPAKP